MAVHFPPTVETAPAACYRVQNGWAWANIYIRHGEGTTGAGDPRGWVELVVNSDFGNFGYCWTHIGAQRWESFLAGVDMHYAMQKLLGPRFRVPLTVGEAAAKGRKMILQHRREGNLDTEDARKLWDALNDAHGDDLTTFLRGWDDGSGGLWYSMDWWDACWDKVNPQAEAFWTEIWPHFVAAITSPAARAA